MSGKPSTRPTQPDATSTLTKFDTKSGAAWLASAPAAIQSEFLKSLTPAELRALPFLFDFWALDHQLPPEGDWRTWVLLGGRGAGKTRAGAEWVRANVEGSRPGDPGRATRVGLIGETIDQVREVMIFGESGILASSPPDRRPRWYSTRKMLEWPNGATAHAYSAHDPDSLRGPQFDLVWADELAKWKKVDAAWEMVQFCLRLGDDPRACVTTTPKNVPALKGLLDQPTTAVSQAPTRANRANLPSAFLEEVERQFAGTTMGMQELDGILLEETEGALWPVTLIDQSRGEAPDAFDRVVVAVDPPVTGTEASDDCGIVVLGVTQDGAPSEWRACVIEDASVAGQSPMGWARAALSAYERHDADRLVAETNQGGEMVETIFRQIAPQVSYSGVHASRSKAARAEPVAALYEQGRVRHVPGLQDLERQMMQMTRAGFTGKGSPDRVDALVWALTEALILPMKTWSRPRLRSL